VPSAANDNLARSFEIVRRQSLQRAVARFPDRPNAPRNRSCRQSAVIGP
jgi:hypothetical protein